MTEIPEHLLARVNKARSRADELVVELKKRPIVVGLTGYAQSGKDTAAAFLVERGWTRLSFADALRNAVYALNPIVWGGCTATDDSEEVRVQDIVDELGYEEAKKQWPEYRALLQRFGTEVGREQFGENFWTDRVVAQIRDGHKYVISDVRFPNEAAVVHNLGGKVFRVKRAGTEAVNTHVSDTGIDNLLVDGVIPNLTTIEHFRHLVLAVVGEPLD